MPQKRNPDSLELIRGIGGGIFGHVTVMQATFCYEIANRVFSVVDS